MVMEDKFDNDRYDELVHLLEDELSNAGHKHISTFSFQVVYTMMNQMKGTEGQSDVFLAGRLLQWFKILGHTNEKEYVEIIKAYKKIEKKTSNIN